MASKPPVSRFAGRSAETGEFMTVAEARANPDTSVVERLPLPGYGENSKKKS